MQLTYLHVNVCCVFVCVFVLYVCFYMCMYNVCVYIFIHHILYVSICVYLCHLFILCTIVLGLAYAVLANLDPVYGLYTAIVPVIVYSIFGTSRHVSIGKHLKEYLCKICTCIL